MNKKLQSSILLYLNEAKQTSLSGRQVDPRFSKGQTIPKPSVLLKVASSIICV